MSYKAKDLSFPLIKKKFLEVTYKLNLAKSQVKPKEKAYSRGIILHKPPQGTTNGPPP
jgi:hypothetical protein